MNKFKFLMLFVAALALFSCKPKPEPAEDEPISGGFQSLIDPEDYTIDDWDNVPAQYLTKIIKDPATTKYGGLDSIYVYADKYYINLLVWVRLDSLPKRDLVPLHLYINADNNNKTGGYDDYFKDGNAELNLEGYLFEGGAVKVYNPAVFIWWGAQGTGIADQSNKTGWYWIEPGKKHDADDKWGAVIGTDEKEVGKSQALNGNKLFEIQIKRPEIISAIHNYPNQELVKGWDWAADKFSIGFDLEMQVAEKSEEVDTPWVLQGLLPSLTEDEYGFPNNPMKTVITIDPNKYE